MKAKSIKGGSAEEIYAALQLSMSDGFKPTLAVTFLSVMQDRAAISGLFDKSVFLFLEYQQRRVYWTRVNTEKSWQFYARYLTQIISPLNFQELSEKITGNTQGNAKKVSRKNFGICFFLLGQ
jgi:hypothetical protein